MGAVFYQWGIAGEKVGGHIAQSPQLQRCIALGILDGQGPDLVEFEQPRGDGCQAGVAIFGQRLVKFGCQHPGGLGQMLGELPMMVPIIHFGHCDDEQRQQGQWQDENTEHQACLEGHRRASRRECRGPVCHRRGACLSSTDGQGYNVLQTFP